MDITGVKIQEKNSYGIGEWASVTVYSNKIYNFHVHKKEMENNYMATS
jgi:hypothetical protein